MIWTYFGLTMRLRDLGENDIGLIFSFGAVMSGVMCLVWGRLADRSKRPQNLVAMGSLLSFLVFLMIPQVETFYGFLTVSCLSGVAASSFMTLMPIMAINAVPEKSAGKGYSHYRIFGSIGFLLGTFGLGFLADQFGLSLAFYCGAGIMLVPAILLGFLKGRVEVEKEIHIEKTDGIQERTTLGLLLLVVFLFSLGGPATFTFLALYADKLGATTQQVGWLIGANGLVALIALPIVGSMSDRFGVRWILFFGLLCQPLRVLGYSFVSDNYWYLFIPQIFHFFTWPSMEIGLPIFVRRIFAAQNQQRVFSYIQFTVVISMILANKLIGWLAETVGYQDMYRFAAVMTAMGFLLFLKIQSQLGKQKAVDSR